MKAKEDVVLARTLNVLVAETKKEYRRLKKLWNNDELFYSPAGSALHVWELTVTDMSDRVSHKWTSLFLTRELAMEHLCETFKARHEPTTYGYRPYEEAWKMLDVGDVKGAFKYITSHISSLYADVRCVEIRASSECRELTTKSMLERK